MTREIKFRGKRRDGKGWLYGNYITYDEDSNLHVFINPPGCYTDNDDHLVFPDTVGQFTGLHDKNGKEIYFDDIVRNKYGDIGSVIWFSDWSLRVDWGGGDIHFIDPEWGLEVIGNIHDNPEMLNTSE